MYWVYDIETYPNIFTFVFRKVGSKREIKIFEISSRKDERLELIAFLRQEGLVLIGFNNVNFDYPVIHYFLLNPNCTLKQWHNHVQEKIIKAEFSRVWEKDVIIPQIDLYLIWHYDNRARATSLKWLEFSLNWYKVQDLPLNPKEPVPVDKIEDLIKYNINDVDFTYEFFGKSLDAIQFRISMSEVLQKDVMNYSDVKIGEYLNRITYEKLTGIKYKNFKDLRTYRDIIPISDLIPDFIKFKTKHFQDFLEEIKSESITTGKGDWYKLLTLGDMRIKFAKGGLHSEDEPGIIKCKDGYYLKEKDVGSMYPKAIISGNYYPEHLGPSWAKGIEQLYEERLNELKPLMKKLPYKSPEYNFIDSKQNAYKLAMNGGGYGKTGSSYSWQYDPLVMYKVTFKGQLSLLMLLEEYYLLGGVELLSANTDGIVIHYPKELDDKVQEIHDKWEQVTQSILEDTFYKKIISRDVNNYIAEIIDGDSGKTIKFKYKGCFEIDPDYHKNKSQRIVAIALKEYFINNVPIYKTIKNHKNIYDFCIGKKATGKTYYMTVDGYGVYEYNDKVIRYYIKRDGRLLFKQLDEERRSAVNKGFKVKMFMEYFDSDDYEIDYMYYINECRKIINPIEISARDVASKKNKQLDIFDLGA